MANPDFIPQTESVSTVMRFFVEKRKRDPHFFESLAAQLWNQATPAERYGIIAVQSVVFGENLEDKERFARTVLLANFLSSPEAIDYITKDRAELQELEALFGAPAIYNESSEPFTGDTELPPVA